VSYDVTRPPAGVDPEKWAAHQSGACGGYYKCGICAAEVSAMKAAEFGRRSRPLTRDERAAEAAKQDRRRAKAKAARHARKAQRRRSR
jgi:hypothetical protein